MRLIKKCIKDLLAGLGYNIYRTNIKEKYKTYWDRPMYAKDVDRIPDNCSGEKVSIILQGPLRQDYDFTLETVKLYKKIYPACQIIVSTWEAESQEYIKKIKDTGAVVIQSKDPGSSYHNINRQRISTLAGINYAINSGAKYILKSRPDQRIYGENAITYLMNMHKVFPLDSDVQAEGRLVSFNSGSVSNWCYCISDMFIFGFAEDVKRYFSCPIEERGEEERKLDNTEDGIAFSKSRPGDIYFGSHYIESLGYELEWTIEDSLYFFRKLFVIIDAESVDWFWHKYTDREYRLRMYKDIRVKKFGFKDWLNNYLGE